MNLERKYAKADEYRHKRIVICSRAAFATGPCGRLCNWTVRPVSYCTAQRGLVRPSHKLCKFHAGFLHL
jgi:hypothetical protein